MMRQTGVVIDQAGNIWSLNNWKPDFDTDVASNPGGDGIIIFVGLAPPGRVGPRNVTASLSQEPDMNLSAHPALIN